MTTKGSEKLSLEIKRPIKAPRDRVYAAWTDPGQLKKRPFGGFPVQGEDPPRKHRTKAESWNFVLAERAA